MDQYEIARAALEKKQLGAAERGFAAILKSAPKDVRATRGMAILRFVQKRYQDALTLARRAIEFDTTDPESPVQLGEFLLALKKHDDALAVLEKACDEHVGSVLAWGTLLKVYRAVGRADEIGPRMERALVANPTSVDLMLHIGNLYGKQGHHEKANTMFARMTVLSPSNAEGQQQRANSLYFLKQYDEAYAAYEAVLRVDPSRAFAHSQKGNVRIAQRRPQDALVDFGKCLQVDPNSYDGLVGIGAALWELNRLDEALTFLQAALQIQPRGVAAFNNLGQVMAAYRADADAILMFDKVHEIEPESKIDAKLSSATSSLRLGNYADGWRRYESRLEMDRIPIVDPAKYAGAQRWNGEDLTGKTLLIVPEQGVGDTIQFCRFVPMVAQTSNAQVVFAANRAVLPLLAGKEHEWAPAGNLRMLAHDDELPLCDYFVPLMSLPFVFGTRVETIPSAQQYLSAPEAYRQKWSSVLPNNGKLRIGLAWAGNPNHVNDRNRSMPIQFLAPLVSDTSVNWVAIQPGLSVHDQRALTTVPHVLNGGAHITDFGDTAALIEQLDVVVAVDTSVAHLAGALGKTVFVMLPWAAEWRWFHERADSPWYPSARLFRQPSLGDWSGLVDQVQQALIDFARAKLTPNVVPLAPVVPVAAPVQLTAGSLVL
ncbi:tetratricopeptide repeat protein [Pararobbsia alpina]|uniref:tetratricopeptide repeat protein n=1 Tax=Pararobbsia alpina TaxID=621374 RepID=UPI0039A669D3